MDREFIPPLPPMPKSKAASQSKFNLMAIGFVVLTAIAAWDIYATYMAIAHLDRQIELADRV